MAAFFGTLVRRFTRDGLKAGVAEGRLACSLLDVRLGGQRAAGERLPSSRPGRSRIDPDREGRVYRRGMTPDRYLLRADGRSDLILCGDSATLFFWPGWFE